MPRGRHRHSPPLHKLLPPASVAGAAVVCAAGAWLFGEPVVLRLLVAAAAAAAVTGVVLMRRRDHSAGRQVAELTRARAADQWKTEERIAELESDLEESRELRARLDAKLRAKRVELAGLRSEHADLLRRYATAETERASALEGRRVLALESGAAAKATPAALPPADSDSAPEAAPEAQVVAEAVDESGAVSPLTPEAFRRAAEALLALEARAEGGHAPRSEVQAESEAGSEVEPEAKSEAKSEVAPEAEAESEVEHAAESEVEHAAESEVEHASETEVGIEGKPEAETKTEPEPKAPEAAGTEAPVEPHTRPAVLRTVPAAAAIVPYAARRPVPRPAGGFDYFGTHAAPGAKKQAAAIEAVQDTDLADVVGEEVLAGADTPSPAAEPRVIGQAMGQVIDLTAHDETEQLDLTELRGAVNS
ncbi:hypothetical protein ACGFRB_16915 [Streptomyces sp. NPDC048718]|uniref:hypothetical protein n=1 Tax=Streptomyces sp. NPDC048718 TaxID=3365587 RepID=UPI003710E103